MNELFKTQVVSGQIVDNNMKIIAYANVKNLTTGFGVQANKDGYFQIPALPTDNLQFTHIAFKTKEVKAGAFDSYIELESMVYQLDEAVVNNQNNGSPKDENDNTVLYVLGAIGISILAYNIFKKKVKTVTV